MKAPFLPTALLFGLVAALNSAAAATATLSPFFTKHCTECHDAATKKGGLDLTSLRPDFADAETSARWVKVHDRIESGEMPPKKSERPPAADVKAVTAYLDEQLHAASLERQKAEGRVASRRMNRTEYENTLRGLERA